MLLILKYNVHMHPFKVIFPEKDCEVCLEFQKKLDEEWMSQNSVRRSEGFRISISHHSSQH